MSNTITNRAEKAMESMREIQNWIRDNTHGVTMKRISDKVFDVYNEHRDEFVLSREFYDREMLAFYIICCEVERIVPVSGY